jgi:hypothetical protein
MIHGSVITYGSEIGNDGMPTPYHSYRIWAVNLTNLSGVAVASIICISGDQQQVNRHISADSERAAFDKAVATLVALPENEGLQITVQES